MITGIGTDIVAIARMISWVDTPHDQLRSVFSEQEITDCLMFKNQPQQAAQRLAARFAAKEAFYKALSATLVNLGIMPEKEFSFLFCARNVSVKNGALGVPMFEINWQTFYEKIGQSLPALVVNLSLTHEKNNALAFVVISRQS